MLDCIAFHDDAVAAATAGRNGGTALTAALFKDDDGIVDADSQGRVPILRDILTAEFDVLTDEVVPKGWWDLQPNKWPNVSRLSGDLDFSYSEITDSAAATQHIHIDKLINVLGKYNIPLTKGLNWISSNSKIAGTIVNADVAMVLVYQYGQAYPYTPGNPLHTIMKVADGAMAAADVFDNAWSSQLTGTTPGLDETKNYILRGVIYEPAAKDKLSALVRVGFQKSEYKMIGLGPGNFLGRVITMYWHDGIPFRGDAGFVAEHLAGVTDTPWAGVVVEELPSGGRGTARTPIATTAAGLMATSGFQASAQRQNVSGAAQQRIAEVLSKGLGLLQKK
jgi:hypothetical protein